MPSLCAIQRQKKQAKKGGFDYQKQWPANEKGRDSNILVRQLGFPYGANKKSRKGRRTPDPTNPFSLFYHMKSRMNTLSNHDETTYMTQEQLTCLR